LRFLGPHKWGTGRIRVTKPRCMKDAVFHVLMFSEGKNDVCSGSVSRKDVKSYTRVCPKVSGLSHIEINNDKHSLRSNTKGYGGKTHKIAIQLHLVAESCTICSRRSRQPVRKLLDTPSYCRISVFRRDDIYVCR
jgi:hypothetical protein